jgi:hypothetical protein
MYERHTLPIITRSYAATCRSPAGENGRQSCCLRVFFSGSSSSPIGSTSAVTPVAGRQAETAEHKLLAAIKPAYHRQQVSPTLNTI